MAVTFNGTISQNAVTSSTTTISWLAATGGTLPQTYAVYASVVSGFTPGSGNLLATGLTGLSYTATGLIPGTKYYFEVIVTDAVPNISDSAQLGIVTAPPVPSMNQFQMVPFLGTVDLAYSYNTQSCMIDPSITTLVYPGAAVKQINPTTSNPVGINGPITVVPCTSDTDLVYGFIQYSMRDVSFSGGSPVEVSCGGNVQYLYATASGNLPIQAQLDLTTNGGVAPNDGSTGANLVGDFIDQPVKGQLARVKLATPQRLYS